VPVIGPRQAGTPALQIRCRRRCVTKLAKKSITVHLSTDEPDGTSVAPTPEASSGRRMYAVGQALRLFVTEVGERGQMAFFLIAYAVQDVLAFLVIALVCKAEIEVQGLSFEHH